MDRQPNSVPYILARVLDVMAKFTKGGLLPESLENGVRDLSPDSQWDNIDASADVEEFRWDPGCFFVSGGPSHECC